MKITQFIQFNILLLFSLFSFSYVLADGDDDLYLINDDFGPNQFVNKEQQYIDCEIDDEGFDIVDSCSGDESILFSWIDTPQSFIASGINSLVTSIDDFFVTDKDKYELSGSYLRLTYDTVFLDAGLIENVNNVNFKLVLPNTEKKLKLSFESDFDEQENNLNQPVEAKSVNEIEDKEFLAMLQNDFGGKEHWRFRSALGSKIGATSDVFLKLNLDWNNNIGEWDFHWNENPTWYNSSGWGLDSLFEINKKLTSNTAFRSATFSRWTETLDYFESSQILSISHRFNSKSAIIYQAGVYGISDPNIVTTSFLLAARYRKNFHKDYLFFELVPQINYQKDNNFIPVHSMTFKIEILFNG